MPRQASVQDEFEITPEMIDAGVSELSAFDPERDNGFEFVRRLYRTMAALAPCYTGREDHRDGHKPRELS